MQPVGSHASVAMATDSDGYIEPSKLAGVARVRLNAGRSLCGTLPYTIGCVSMFVYAGAQKDEAVG
jgi:hypothetical protein